MNQDHHDDEVDYEREGEILDAALRRPESEREAYVRAEAGDDTRLVEAVLSLLRLQPEASDFLEKSISEQTRDPARWIGRQVGDFRILRPLAEGGMGMVFLAEQNQPRREVAIKILRTGQGSPEMLRRFELEAQALARLDHPHIARIYDAGTVDGPAGPAPYLAMEFVDGEPLLDFAASSQLDRDARIDLWTRLCDAVHHAHQNAVIHRDLKPANILVRKDGRPAVLDFGVARIHDPDATTLHTQAGQIVGTVAYMSPEQLRGERNRIDLRSDVYALGVLGHELLLGTLPHDLQEKSIGEAVTAVTTSEAPLQTSARALAEDLRAILDGCLRLERDERYASAAELARDLQRFRRDEPIARRAPDLGEQMRRFTRRHRGLVAGSALALVALVAGLVISVAGWNSAARARRAAELSATRAELMNDYLQDVLTSADPRVDGREVKVVDVLERASTRLEGRLRSEPEVAIAALAQLGDTFSELGVYERAGQIYDRSLALADSVFSRDDPRRIVPLRNLGAFYLDEGQLDDANRLAIEVQRLLAMSPPQELAMEGIHFLGALAEARGEREQAVDHYRRSLDASLRLLGPEHQETLTTQVALGVVLFQLERLDEAQSQLETAYETYVRNEGDDHPETQIARNNLAFVYKAMDRHEEALAMFERSLDSRQRVFGDRSSSAAIGEHNLALQLSEMGRPDQALVHHDRAIEILRENFGPDHPRVFIARAARGGTLHRLQRSEEARSELEASHAGMAGTLGPGHWRVKKVAEQLIELCEAAGDEEAASRYRESLARP